MGWAVGYDTDWHRDIGYGVPALCDQPDCGKTINRGLGYVCGGEPYGGDAGCGLYFCVDHLLHLNQLGPNDGSPVCIQCLTEDDPFEPTPDTPEWCRHKLTDPSWGPWRAEQTPEAIEALRVAAAA